MLKTCTILVNSISAEPFGFGVFNDTEFSFSSHLFFSVNILDSIHPQHIHSSNRVCVPLPTASVDDDDERKRGGGEYQDGALLS